MASEMLDWAAKEIAAEIMELTASQRATFQFPDDANGDTIERARSAAELVIAAMPPNPPKALQDASAKHEPLRRYIAVYKVAGELRLSHIAFDNQIAAWTKPRGPNVPKDIEIVDVVDVKYPA